MSFLGCKLNFKAMQSFQTDYMLSLLKQIISEGHISVTGCVSIHSPNKNCPFLKPASPSAKTY